ncbi:hypothetical protein EX30DRAFT_339379 [Ascodesmis nigricans]|uniref:Uncharacterized protein n=1 Tax=Ascodesmis nigricans TaxID=341454 RepID=A0A4S2N274_9PEZI|nr:hypothetical protein EX30DRAFT_339379 [Ascodesmis nigricans]
MTPTSVLWTTLHILLLPLQTLATIILFIISPLTLLIGLLFRGLIHVFITVPGQIMTQFESVYVYCGCAIIIGLLLGATTALISRILTDSLGTPTKDLDTTDSAASNIDEEAVPDVKQEAAEWSSGGYRDVILEEDEGEEEEERYRRRRDRGW